MKRFEHWSKNQLVRYIEALEAHYEPNALHALRDFTESIVSVRGPYPDLNGHQIIHDAYVALGQVKPPKD